MKKFLFVLGMFGFVAGAAFAANFDNHTVNLVVRQIQALTMNGGGDITMTIDDAGGTLMGGAMPQAVTDSTQRLRYTVINPGVVKQKIQVSASGGAPTGTTLTVVATGVAGPAGTPAAAVTVSAISVDLIGTIGNIATGIGAASGALLTYSFELVDIASVAVATTPLVVTYTILDQ